MDEVSHFGPRLRVATKGGADPIALSLSVLGSLENAREVPPTVEDAFVSMVREEKA